MGEIGAGLFTSSLLTTDAENGILMKAFRIREACNMQNILYYGDNLEILRNPEYFPNEFVDLIYLDPPFNSNRNYNVLFKAESGADSEAQITAFEDTWHWSETALSTYFDLVQQGPATVATAIKALKSLIGHNQMMAYLVMMAARLVELERVLKPTGSLYLHCDPTASHYLKILLDAILGVENYRNHITWKRTSSHSSAKKWGRYLTTFYSIQKAMILCGTRSINHTINNMSTIIIAMKTKEDGIG